MKAALHESIIDTFIAAAINMPLNFLILSITTSLSLTVLQTTIIVTSFFTVIAIIRKTAVRLHFDKKLIKK